MTGLNVVVDFGIHGNVDFLPCFSPQDFYQLSYYVQGVPTCLGQAKYNILKLRSLPAKMTNFTERMYSAP